MGSVSGNIFSLPALLGEGTVVFVVKAQHSSIADTYGTLPWVPNTMDTFETEEQEVQRPWGQEG